MDGVKEGGGEAVPETVAGDPDRVDGAFTAMESTVEVVVDRDVVDPVRKRDAASRGREAAEAVAALAGAPVGLFAPFVPALMLILAASWFKDGMRLFPGLWACGASTEGAAAGGGVAAIVVV